MRRELLAKLKARSRNLNSHVIETQETTSKLRTAALASQLSGTQPRLYEAHLSYCIPSPLQDELLRYSSTGFQGCCSEAACSTCTCCSIHYLAASEAVRCSTILYNTGYEEDQGMIQRER